MTHLHPSPDMSSLPFVHQDMDPSNWHAPETDDFCEACDRGQEYAARFVKSLRDDPDLVETNVLGLLVSKIDFADQSAKKGYWVGFFSYLERLLYAQGGQMDVMADVRRLNAEAADLRREEDEMICE